MQRQDSALISNSGDDQGDLLAWGSDDPSGGVPDYSEDDGKQQAKFETVFDSTQ